MAQPGPPTTTHVPISAPLEEAEGDVATRFAPGQCGGSAVFVSRLGVRLIHMVIAVEQLAASGATVSGLRARATG